MKQAILSQASYETVIRLKIINESNHPFAQCSILHLKRVAPTNMYWQVPLFSMTRFYSPAPSIYK